MNTIVKKALVENLLPVAIAFIGGMMVGKGMEGLKNARKAKQELVETELIEEQ